MTNTKIASPDDWQGQALALSVALGDLLKATIAHVDLPHDVADSIRALRVTADFLDQAAFAAINAGTLDDAEVTGPLKWAIGKLFEAVAGLPASARVMPAKWLVALADSGTDVAEGR